VPVRALACPECGADAEAGWSDEPSWAGALPAGYSEDDDFDEEAYQEFLRREGLSEDERTSRAGQQRRGSVFVALLLVICGLLWLASR